MTFLMSLLNRAKSPEPDEAFATRMRRIQRSQPADARFQSLFSRQPQEDLAV